MCFFAGVYRSGVEHRCKLSVDGAACRDKIMTRVMTMGFEFVDVKRVEWLRKYYRSY